jgi:hypothetical protein
MVGDALKELNDVPDVVRFRKLGCGDKADTSSSAAASRSKTRYTLAYLHSPLHHSNMRESHVFATLTRLAKAHACNVPRNQPDHVTNPIKKSHLLALKIYYSTTTG